MKTVSVLPNSLCIPAHAICHILLICFDFTWYLAVLLAECSFSIILQQITDFMKTVSVLPNSLCIPARAICHILFIRFDFTWHLAVLLAECGLSVRIGRLVFHYIHLLPMLVLEVRRVCRQVKRLVNTNVLDVERMRNFTPG